MKKIKVTFTQEERLIAFNALRYAIQDTAPLPVEYTDHDLQKRAVRLAQSQIFDKIDWAWHRNTPIKYSLPPSDVAVIVLAVLEAEGQIRLTDVSFSTLRNKISELIKKINQPYYE